MKTRLIICFLIISLYTFAQPKIQFQLEEYDFGTIATRGTIKKSFPFKNIGNEPLIIAKTRTGDGGSYAAYPRNPILPDSTGIITFVYDSKRIGSFRKCISVQYNSKRPNAACKIRIKGNIIHKITAIEIQNDTIDIGEIPFGTIEKVSFEIKNIGQEKLYLTLLNHQYYEADLFYQNIRPKVMRPEISNKSGIPYEPNQIATINIALRNIYGNVGKFERKLSLKYNSLDTAKLVIIGEYIGQSTQSIIYESRTIFEYENGQLQKLIRINYSGDVEKEAYFDLANCEKEIFFSWITDKIRLKRYYENGVLVREEKPDH